MSIAEPLLLGRERLLREAEKLFAEHGYSAVSIRDITQATGMSAGALYHHFSSKEDLFFQLLELNLQEVSRSVREAISQANTPREQISRVCGFYFSWQPQKRKLFEQVFRELPRFNPGRVQNFTLQVREEYLVIVEDILREGMARGEVLPINPRLAAAALHGILRMMTNETLVGKHLATAARAEFAVNLLFDGIGTHVQRPETS
jgi:TetR/AcrR family transcriptional regulator, cholesterol catabolism regulator